MDWDLFGEFILSIIFLLFLCTYLLNVYALTYYYLWPNIFVHSLESFLPGYIAATEKTIHRKISPFCDQGHRVHIWIGYLHNKSNRDFFICLVHVAFIYKLYTWNKPRLFWLCISSCWLWLGALERFIQKTGEIIKAQTKATEHPAVEEWIVNMMELVEMAKWIVR